MSIAVGDKIPDVEVKTMGPEGPKTVKTGEVLGTGKVVLFVVPGRVHARVLEDPSAGLRGAR